MKKIFLTIIVTAAISGSAGWSIAEEAGFPRLFFCNDEIPVLKQKVQSGWLKDAFDEMKENADDYMLVSANPYPMSSRETNGDATAGRALNERVNTLALTGMLLDDLSYIDHAIAMCMSAIGQTDVNDFYSYNDHLSVADGMHAYAVAYDWLYNYMTPTQRTALYDEIIEFMDWLYDDSVAAKPFEPTPLSSNHNSVHHGALGLAALAVSTNVTPELERAATFVEGYFRYARDASGYNSEGIGYYGYGSLGAVPFSVAYERAGHGSLIDAHPRNQLVSEYVMRFVQPWGGSVVALNDSNDLAVGGGMMEFISRYQDRVGLWAWLKMFGPEGDGTYSGPDGSYIGMGCTIPYVILFADETLQPLSPAEAGIPQGKFFDRGTGAFRSSWEDDAALATFTCGPDIHRGHNHRDEGSFTFSAFGEYFVIDPGYAPYMGRAHNCVMVNGVDQDKEPEEYDTYGMTLGTKDFGTAWYMKGDATPAYPDALNLDRAIRQFMFVDAPQPYMVVHDDIEDAAGSATNVFSWLLHAGKDSVVVPGPTAGEFYLEGAAAGGAVCYVKFLSPTSGLTFAETDLSGVLFTNSIGGTGYFSNYFRELSVNYTGVNPGFTAILMAAESIADLPQLQTSQTTNGLQVNVLFPNDGIEDRIDVTDGDMDFHRLGEAYYVDSDMPTGSVYYLQGSMPAGDSILDKAYWFNERSSGSSMPAGEPFAGNRFDVNRNYWRSPNTSGTAVFDGRLVVDTIGSGLLVHYCADLHLDGGMELDSQLAVRPHRTSVSLTVPDLVLGASGDLIFRTLVSNNNSQNLSVGNLSGSGIIRFGTSYNNDTNGVWSLSVTDPDSDFSGQVQLLAGQLTFENALTLPDATFRVEPSWDNDVVLAHDVEFRSLTFGTTALLTGSYTAEQLNAVLGTDRFSGGGMLTVSPPLDDFAVWAKANGLSGDEALSDADPEQDGMNNLLEYALGGDPNLDDAAAVMPANYIVQVSGTNWMEYVYRRRMDAGARGLEYNLLLSTNLVSRVWTNIGHTAEVGTATVDDEIETVTNRVPTTHDQCFIKLEISRD